MATQTGDPTTTGYGTGSGPERLQESASTLVDQAGRTAEATASRTMGQAGDALDQVAQAVRDASTGLRDQQPMVADFADTAAEKVESVAEFLRSHRAGELMGEATEFARRQPIVVVGGAMLVGLALGRIVKSSTSGMNIGSQGGYGSYGTTSRYGTSGSWPGDGGSRSQGWDYREPYGSGTYPRTGGTGYGAPSSARGSGSNGESAYGTSSGTGTQSGYAGGRSGVTTEDAGAGTSTSDVTTTGTTQTTSEKRG